MVFGALLFATTAKAQAPEIELAPMPTDPKGLIEHFADVYGANTNELLTVAFCESGYKPHAVGDGGRAVGVFQYHKPTFISYSKKLGEELNYHSTYDQAKLTAFIWTNYPKEKRAWTCYTKNFMG